MKQLTIREAADFLLRNDNYVLLTHRRPDGDTIGSAAALCAGLRSLGKTAHVLENPQFTERFRQDKKKALHNKYYAKTMRNAVRLAGTIA